MYEVICWVFEYEVVLYIILKMWWDWGWVWGVRFDYFCSFFILLVKFVRSFVILFVIWDRFFVFLWVLCFGGLLGIEICLNCKIFLILCSCLIVIMRCVCSFVVRFGLILGFVIGLCFFVFCVGIFVSFCLCVVCWDNLLCWWLFL